MKKLLTLTVILALVFSMTSCLTNIDVNQPDVDVDNVGVKVEMSE